MKKSSVVLTREKILQIAEVLDTSGGINPEPFLPVYDAKFHVMFNDILLNHSLGDFFKSAVNDQITYKTIEEQEAQQLDIPWSLGDGVIISIPDNFLITDLKFIDEDYETFSTLSTRGRDKNNSEATSTTSVKNEVFYAFLGLVSLLYKNETHRPKINLIKFLSKRGSLKNYLKLLPACEVYALNPRLKDCKYIPKNYIPPGPIDEPGLNRCNLSFIRKLLIIFASVAPEEEGQIYYKHLGQIFFPEIQGINDPDHDDVNKLKIQISKARQSFCISKK